MPEQASNRAQTYAELQGRVKRLEESYARCERLSVANDYAAAVMHEVNNPLEAMSNLVYLARQEKPSAPVEGYLEQIQEQMEMLAAITRSSLAFYKGQSQPNEIDLMQIAESALKLHLLRLQRAGVRVSKRYGEDTVCSGIASELLQVLSNLILNAADAVAETPEAQISVSVRRTGDLLRVSVCDNGSGIPEHIEPRVFNAHATGKPTGTGMGLWLCKRIVMKHGGALRYRTSRRTGRSGTVFCVTLPRAGQRWDRRAEKSASPRAWGS